MIFLFNWVILRLVTVMLVIFLKYKGTLKIIMFDLHGALCWPVSHNKMLHDFSEAYLDVPLEVGLNGQ